MSKTPDHDKTETALATLRAEATNERAAARIFDEVLDLIRPYHSSVFWGDRMLTLDKTAGFRRDLIFQNAIKATSSSTGANQYASPDGVTWRFNTLIWAAQQALRTPGDFVECGVYEGDMSWVVTEIINLLAADRKMHLFDTFSGFSDKYSSPTDFPDAPQFFEFANREYNRPGIFERVRDRFAKKPYVILHKGTVPDSLIDAPGSIAFLHLDLNSPGPESAALDILFDRISPGGIIIFDDYGWRLMRKQKQAADAFMSTKGLTILELPTGQGLFVKPS